MEVDGKLQAPMVLPRERKPVVTCLEIRKSPPTGIRSPVRPGLLIAPLPTMLYRQHKVPIKIINILTDILALKHANCLLQTNNIRLTNQALRYKLQGEVELRN
jgi:hypothetical protein